MEIRQRTEQRKLLIPALRQSLNILALPLLDLKALISQELESNPLLEETAPSSAEMLEEYLSSSPIPQKTPSATDSELALSLQAKNVSLQEVLLRQLGMFSKTDEDFKIGQEIIGNINDDGYLEADTPQIATTLGVPLEKVEAVLKLIQHFDPPGVAARSVEECLAIQLELSAALDPLTKNIIEHHLNDIAKKNFTHIAKCLKEPLEKILPIIERITKLNPKPGLGYDTGYVQHILPDITIDDDCDELKITINNEEIPLLRINTKYLEMLKSDNLDQLTRQFLTDKLQGAQELLRAINKRQETLKKVIAVIAEIQVDAIRDGMSSLRPLTFQEVARKINMHESTVCRVVMDKYARIPCGTVALKDFFCSHVHSEDGQAVSANRVKGIIKELIDNENPQHPLSDEELLKRLQREGLHLARRTVAKYREDLKILSSVYRRQK